jgi:hypothetical protein
MATNPIFSKQLKLYMDASLVAYATDINFDVSKEFIEIAWLYSGAKRQIPDQYNASISGSGLVFREASTGDKGTFAAMVNNITAGDASIAWELKPDVSTNVKYSGAGYLSNTSMSAGVGSPVSYNFTLNVDGPITIGLT